jgi:hypothetical protein
VDALYYVSYLLSSEVWRFVRARKFGKARIEATEVYGPMKRGLPDFEKMAEIVRGCAAYPVIESFRAAYHEQVDVRFAKLAAEWRQGRKATSSVARMAQHPAYQQIITMGYSAVPLILQELANEPDHWFVALNKITNENPVNGDARGRLADMAAAWLTWGRHKGYVTTS